MNMWLFPLHNTIKHESKKHTITAIIDPHKHATGNAQRGIVTHYHDQLITLHNFNVINTIASNPKNPIPLPDVFVWLLIIMLLDGQ